MPTVVEGFKMMRIFYLCSLLLCCVLGQGCSVGMAMSGKPDPNMAIVKPGATRGEIELQLGKPIQTASNPDGTRVDQYKYEIGNEPSAGRAIGHGVMDVLTLGLWEVIGTPIEAFQGTTYQIQVTYDRNDRVLGVNQASPATPPKESTP
jgi:hypothetical protein